MAIHLLDRIESGDDSVRPKWEAELEELRRIARLVDPEVRAGLILEALSAVRKHVQKTTQEEKSAFQLGQIAGSVAAGGSQVAMETELAEWHAERCGLAESMPEMRMAAGDGLGALLNVIDRVGH